MIKEYDIEFDFNRLKLDVETVLKEYEPHPWLGEESWYSGIGLTHNPMLPADIHFHQQALGYPPNNPYLRKHLDTRNFNSLTPAGLKLKWFLDLFDMEIQKSRIAIVDGSKWINEGWHIDESLEVCKRINVPLTDNPNFKIQLDNQQPVSLSVGKCYTWDTSKYHRVFVEKGTTEKRISLVLGFKPK